MKYLVLLNNYEQNYGLFTNLDDAKTFAKEHINENPHIYVIDSNSEIKLLN